jgi:hypothetical protein
VNNDRQLEERLKQLCWPVDRGGGWDSIEAQAGSPSKRVSASARRSGLRVAVLASLAIILVAAVAVGSIEVVRHLGNQRFVLRITGEPVAATGGQQTTPP